MPSTIRWNDLCYCVILMFDKLNHINASLQLQKVIKELMYKMPRHLDSLSVRWLVLLGFFTFCLVWLEFKILKCGHFVTSYHLIIRASSSVTIQTDLSSIKTTLFESTFCPLKTTQLK